MDTQADPGQPSGPAPAEVGDSQPQRLVWRFAREVTSWLEQGRRRVEEVAEDAAGRTRRVFGRLRDVADDAATYADVTPWLEGFYASVGIASSTSLAELDEKLDDLEVRIEQLARQRARGELLLLQTRIAELESIMASVTRQETREAVFELVDKLGDLEARIDALPWRTIRDESYEVG